MLGVIVLYVYYLGCRVLREGLGENGAGRLAIGQAVWDPIGVCPCTPQAVLKRRFPLQKGQNTQKSYCPWMP